MFYILKVFISVLLQAKNNCHCLLVKQLYNSNDWILKFKLDDI